MNFKNLLVASLFLAAAACSSNAKLVAPDGFAQLDSGDDYSFRATSASGVVIGVRTEDNDPKGNIDFWTSALDYKLQNSGYTVLGKGPEKISTDKGLVGRQMKYSMTKNGRPHEYWVTVFVTDSRVIVVEAAGDQAFFDGAAKKRIDAAVRTVSLG